MAVRRALSGVCANRCDTRVTRAALRVVLYRPVGFVRARDWRHFGNTGVFAADIFDDGRSNPREHAIFGFSLPDFPAKIGHVAGAAC